MNAQSKQSWTQTWWGTLTLIMLVGGIIFILAVAYAVLEKIETGKRLFLEQNRAQFESVTGVSQVTIETTDDPSRGKQDAPVRIVEFSDFQCPFCKKAYPEVKAVLAQYPDAVYFVYRDFPVTYSHPDALNAAMAGECAQDAGKFWEYHDILFDRQDDLSVAALKQYAFLTGIPAAEFNECLDSQKYRNEVLNDFEEGQRLGVNGTPTFFINGARVPGVVSFDVFRQIIDRLLLAQQK